MGEPWGRFYGPERAGEPSLWRMQLIVAYMTSRVGCIIIRQIYNNCYIDRYSNLKTYII